MILFFVSAKICIYKCLCLLTTDDDHYQRYVPGLPCPTTKEKKKDKLSVGSKPLTNKIRARQTIGRNTDI